MMVNGPWIFPKLNAKGWKYNDQYGIVPIPTDKAGQTVVAPLGGETLECSRSAAADLALAGRRPGRTRARAAASRPRRLLMIAI